MTFDEVAKLWSAYLALQPVEDIHEEDTMWSNGKDWYWSVGESAISAIFSHLPQTRLRAVNSVLDFGCAWGRVARQLRRAFPAAELYLCDLNEPAARFCAETFLGDLVGGDELPENIDLIWVGSVFTHIDYDAMRDLFEKLIKSLSPNGLLVATFHGRRVIEIGKRVPYIKAEKWGNIIKDYHENGHGYESYGLDHLGNYGVSLTKPQFIYDLGSGNSDLRLVGMEEAGWANHQDVAAWSKTSIED